MSLAVAQQWYDVVEVEPGIVKICEPHVVRLFRGNFFLVRGATRDLLVDTGMGVGDMRGLLAGLGAKNPIVFTTHTHIDHIGGHPALADHEIVVHAAEAEALRAPPMPAGLSYSQFNEADRAAFRASGFDTSGLLIDALPQEGFDPLAFRFSGATPSRTVGEGDVIDLGNRAFEVLHLPGHSPGSIALWDARDGMLISGDAIYDGVLVDTLEGSDIPTYLRTMARMRELPVRVVHGGHRTAFGRQRMIEVIDAYVASRTDPARTAPEATITF